MKPINKEIFLQNLLLTQIYCEQQLKKTEKETASIFRSILPTYEGKPIWEIKQQIIQNEAIMLADWTKSPVENDSFLENVFEAQLNFKKKHLTYLNLKEKHEGAILVSEFYQTTVDGASSAYSKGLFDDFDLPPIDTWFYYTGNIQDYTGNFHVVFAWIPKSFQKLAQNAVDVNCFDLIQWFEVWNPEEYSRLMR
jgi:hypothetical protein